MMLEALLWWMMGFIGAVLLAIPLTVIRQANVMLHDAIEV